MNDFKFNNFEQFQLNTPYWQKYDDAIKNMSSEQKIFVSKQENVLQAKQNLMSAFIDYLFEQHKNTFVIANNSAKELADKYIDAIKVAADSYVSRSEQLENENNELKKQIQQLMLDFEGRNGKNTTTAE